MLEFAVIRFNDEMLRLGVHDINGKAYELQTWYTDEAR